MRVRSRSNGWAGLLLLGALVAGCDETVESGPGTWTVLVYMNADNDLEPAALEDLREMMAVESSTAARIVVQVDRHPAYDNGEIGGLDDFTSTKRVLVEPGSLRELEDLGELDLAAPKALSDFVAWGMEKYPAEKTALVFWDHGGGWTGFGVDESTGEGELLTVPEIETGLRSGLGDKKLALIGFDACLMASFETADTLAPFASYFLASEDLEPGHGWDWRSMQLLMSTPTSNPEELSGQIISDYKAQAEVNDTAAAITLSLVDLSELPALKAAVDSFSQAVASGGEPASVALARARENARSYQSSSPDPSRSQFLYDLGSLAGVAAELHSPLAASSTELRNVLGRAIKKNHFGSAQAGSSGLTVYFPPSPESVRVGYDQLSGGSSWRGLVSKVHGAASVVPLFTNANKKATASFQSNSLVLTGDLAPGAANVITRASMFYGVTLGTDTYLLGDEPTSYSASSVQASWNLSALVLAQGTNEALGYASWEVSGAYWLLTIDFVYQASPTAAAEYAPRQVVLSNSGATIVSDTYYVSNGSTFGELTPVAGSQLTPVVKSIDTNGNVAYALATSTPFTASTDANGRPAFDIKLEFRSLNAGTQVVAGLEIRNAAGRGDLFSVAETLP